MKLIDKDRLIKTFENWLKVKLPDMSDFDDGIIFGYERCIHEIEKMPIIEERKHGYWTKDGKCSCCSSPAATDTAYDYLSLKDQKFCYACGAIMDEAEVIK